MDPTKWEPHTWFFFFSITFNYPKRPTIYQKNKMFDFRVGLQPAPYVAPNI